jgi:hypothetical protein
MNPWAVAIGLAIGGASRRRRDRERDARLAAVEYQIAAAQWWPYPPPPVAHRRHYT